MELVSTEVENWDSYDIVLIGYPIWWGIAAWPTDGFVKANDFTGKTVIPSVLPQVPESDRAENCWLTLQEPETGRKDSVLLPVRLTRKSQPGLQDLD